MTENAREWLKASRRSILQRLVFNEALSGEDLATLCAEYAAHCREQDAARIKELEAELTTTKKELLFEKERRILADSEFNLIRAETATYKASIPERAWKASEELADNSVEMLGTGAMRNCFVRDVTAIIARIMEGGE